MNLWLYQLNATKWTKETYRAEVWEGDIQHWNVGEIRRAVSGSGSLPERGDMMLLFYVPKDQDDPGIYGWGIILRHGKNELDFRLATPSDYLKMNPLWDDDVIATVKRIRGGFNNATLFEDPSDSLKHVRKRIARHVYGRALRPRD